MFPNEGNIFPILSRSFKNGLNYSFDFFNDGEALFKNGVLSITDSIFRKIVY